MPAGTRDFSLSQNVQTGSGATQPPVPWLQEFFPEGEKLTTHFHLMPRLRISGAVPLYPPLPYAFMAWTVENVFRYRYATQLYLINRRLFK